PRGRGFASNSYSLRIVTRFAHHHLKTISSPFHECCRRYSPFSGREGHVRAGRIADDLKVLVDAADDGRARVQSHRDTQRTDYFCKHRGNVVSQVELATSKQAFCLSRTAPNMKRRHDMRVQLTRLGEATVIVSD